VTRWMSLSMLAMLVTVCANAATITVRKDGTGDYAVIQAALDVAAAGDTILIGPGEYLEHTAVRFPAWLHDIESYANVTVDNLTIIGAGSDQTFIGPLTYSGNYNTESPMVVTYIAGGDIRIADVCMRNSHTGIAVGGRLFMDRCVLFDNYINVSWEAVGSGGWIRNSQFDVVTPNFPISIDIINSSGAANILVESCSVLHSLTLIDGVDGITFDNCSFADTPTALHVYGQSHVVINDSHLMGLTTLGVLMAMGSGSLCEIVNSTISSAQAALKSDESDSRFVVSGSRLEGGTYAVLVAQGASGACQLTGCDLVRVSGPVVRCGVGGSPVVHDLRNNYWGTADDATIQSWIIDHNDDPSIGATVLYSPFAGQSVPAEPTSWGDLKASFR
jgi:hypothetical protein